MVSTRDVYLGYPSRMPTWEVGFIWDTREESRTFYLWRSHEITYLWDSSLCILVFDGVDLNGGVRPMHVLQKLKPSLVRTACRVSFFNPREWGQLTASYNTFYGDYGTQWYQIVSRDWFWRGCCNLADFCRIDEVKTTYYCNSWELQTLYGVQRLYSSSFASAIERRKWSEIWNIEIKTRNSRICLFVMFIPDIAPEYPLMVSIWDAHWACRDLHVGTDIWDVHLRYWVIESC